MGTTPRTVHLVAKTHLDLGFTAGAGEVVERYLTDFFPRAVDVARRLRSRGGPQRLVWTTGSWILDAALDRAEPDVRALVDEAIRAGDLAWHALPLTTHTELGDADLIRSGLAVSARLDDRFGRSTTAAKLTDVPGHTRSLVPLLAEAGVTFVHIGVNPAWPLPEVPPVFRWRSPDGSEVTVAYQDGGYGGEVVVPGCDDVLAFLHSGDNLGPPTVDEVLGAHVELAARHPDAVVVASTLDAFARAVDASGAVAELPVVTAEIGDPWIFGVGSDPMKVATLRSLLRARRSTADPVDPVDPGDPSTTAAVDAALLTVIEHTWGLDQKTWLPDDRRWDRPGLAELRASAEGARFEASWDEQRAYLDVAARALDPMASDPPPSGVVASRADRIRPPALGPDAAPAGERWRTLTPGEVVGTGPWSLAIDHRGALGHVRLDGSDNDGAGGAGAGRVLADADHPLGLVTYQSFDEADYERFYAQLTPTPDDEWWARWDNTKPGIDAAGAVSGSWPTELVAAWHRPGADGERDSDGDGEVLVRSRFTGVATDRLGAPREVWSRWRARTGVADPAGAVLTGEVWWVGKPANRLPEALWCSFTPAVAAPQRWTFDKLGSSVSPLDVVRRGGRALHAVGDGGMTHAGPEGRLRLTSLDAALVAPGVPNLLDADPGPPDLAGGLHVLLADNCWGTNFPMWIEGPARNRFVLLASDPTGG